VGSVGYERAESRDRTGRRWRLFAAVAASLGTLLVVTGGVLALAQGSATPQAEAATAARAAGSPARPAPGAPGTVSSSSVPGALRDVVLHDEGTSITLTWADPVDGTGSVLLSYGRAGQPTGSVRTLPAGTHHERLTGLDPAADYCVVLAVASPQDTVARATEVCTRRRR
jgi:hypothetical protein